MRNYKREGVVGENDKGEPSKKKKLRNFGHGAKFLDPPSPREVWTQIVWTLRMGSDPPLPLP